MHSLLAVSVSVGSTHLEPGHAGDFRAHLRVILALVLITWHWSLLIVQLFNDSPNQFCWPNWWLLLPRPCPFPQWYRPFTPLLPLFGRRPREHQQIYHFDLTCLWALPSFWIAATSDWKMAPTWTTRGLWIVINVCTDAKCVMGHLKVVWEIQSLLVIVSFWQTWKSWLSGRMESDCF